MSGQWQVTSMPPGVLGRVGGGSVRSCNPVPVKAISAARLIQGGEPEMLYTGAEFCPCCAELGGRGRWR